MPKSHSTLVFAVSFSLAALASACTSSPSPASTRTRPPASPSATPSACAGDTGDHLYGSRLIDPDGQVEILWRSAFVPWWVRTSGDGRIIAVTDGGDSIYELLPDGTLDVAFQCPGVAIETAVAASDGALWFAARDGGRLYKVDPQGSVSIVAPAGERNLEAGLNGSVYAMENGLVRIDPDGTREIITMAVRGRKFAIGLEGQIVALSEGNIAHISNSGEITQIASGYGPEPWLTFGPDGLLYVTHWTGVDVIDLETGEISPIPWLENSNLAESGAFAPDGRLLMYHPNTNVFAVDLEAQTIEVFYQVLSNSWAMAVNPGDGVYVAFGNGLAEGETTIYRISDEATLEPVASVPYGLERSMAFDSQGTGYLGVADARGGAAIFRFDPSNGEVEEYVRPQCFPKFFAVDPQTDRLWWEECNRFASMGDDGIQTVIEGVPGGENASLEITASGEFYTITFFRRDDPGMLYQHRLYRWDPDASVWEEMADLTQSDPGISLATLTSCPDGRIYTVESLDSSNLPVPRSSFNAIRRLEPDGSLTLIGYDFAYDGLAADCDPLTGRIIFTSGAGIFAVTPPLE